MTRVVLTARAERSTAELMFAWAAHRRWQRHRLLLPLGRLSRFGASGTNPVGYLALPHVAAVAEEYSRNMLLTCSAPFVPQVHPILEELWDRAEREADTWSGQERAWKAWHSIEFARAPEYKDLRGVIEARNAIVHGLGLLTQRQLRGKDGGKKIADALKRVGIRVSARRLVLDDEAMRLCVDASRRFIEWLDFEVQAKGL